ncbi:MAG: tetratricopeptide repeat protein [Mariniphaga sp.]
MKENTIKLDGNNNIVIQDATNGNITINTNDPVILEKIQQLNKEQIAVLQQIVIEQSAKFSGLFKTLLAGVASQKNVVHGNINATLVKIGDEIHYHYGEKRADFKQIGKEFLEFDTSQIFLRLKDLIVVEDALKENDIVVIVGKQGTGKSFLLKYLYCKAKNQYEEGAYFTANSDIVTILSKYNVSVDVTNQDTLSDIASKKIFEISNRSNNHLTVINGVKNITEGEIQFLGKIPLQSANSQRDNRSRIKILLSSIQPIPEFKNIELPPLSFDQIKQFAEFISSRFGNETQIIFKTIENNLFLTKLLESNVPRETSRATNDIGAIIEAIKAVDNPQKKFVEKILGLYPLSPVEEWILMQFTVLPLKQYDTDDLTLLLLKDEFKITNLEIANAAFIGTINWFANYCECLTNASIVFDADVVSVHFAIVKEAILELRTELAQVTNNLAEDKLRQYFSLDKYDKESFNDVCDNIITSQQEAQKHFQYLKSNFEVSDIEIPTILESINQTILKIKQAIENLDNVDYGTSVLELTQTESFISYCGGMQYEMPVDIELETVLNSLGAKAWLEHSENCYSLSETACQILRQIFIYKPAYFTDIINSIDLMYFTRPSGKTYINLSWFNNSDATAKFIEHAECLVHSFPIDKFDYSLLALYDKLIESYDSQIAYSKELQHRLEYVQIVEYIEKYDTEFKAEAYDKLLRIYIVLGNLASAKQYGEKAKKIALRIFPEDHTFVSFIYNDLATVLLDLGDYAGAKKLLEKAVTIDEKNFGVEHPSTATSYSNLATVLQNLDDHDGAKQFLEKAVMSDEKNFGVEHPSTAKSYSNLAMVLRDLGDYAGAKQLLEKAVMSNEKNFGVEHPSTAGSYENLAMILRDLGDYDGAKQLMEKAIKSNEKNFGVEHPETAGSYYRFAWVYVDLKEIGKAVELWEKCYLVWSNCLGDDHPDTQMVIEALNYYKKIN